MQAFRAAMQVLQFQIPLPDLLWLGDVVLYPGMDRTKVALIVTITDY